MINERGEAFLYYNDPLFLWRDNVYLALADRELIACDGRAGPFHFDAEVDARWMNYLSGGFRMMIVLANDRTGEALSGKYQPVYDWSNARSNPAH